MELALQTVVDSLEDALRRGSAAIAEREILGTALHLAADGTKGTRSIGIHRRGQCSILVDGIVEGQIAVIVAVSELGIAAGTEHRPDGCHHQDMGYTLCHPSTSFRSASVTCSKWNPHSVSCIRAATCSLHKLPIDPSWVWWMLRSAQKVPASISSPTFL